MITEQFDCGLGVPGLGSFDVRFRRGSVSRLLGPYVAVSIGGEREGPVQNWGDDTLVVTPGRLTSPTRSALLAAAIYSGELLTFTAEPGGTWKAGGKSILNWLGTDDLAGSAVCLGTDYPPTSLYGSSVATYMADLVSGGLVNAFTIDATAASLSGAALNTALRDMDCARVRINQACQASQSEYWCNPDFSLTLAGVGGTEVFRQTPTVLFAQGVRSSRTSTMAAYECDVLPSYDFNRACTALTKRNTDGTGSAIQSVGGGILPNDTSGTGNGVRAKFLGASDDLMAQGYPSTEQYRRADTVTVNVRSKTLRIDLQPGDYVYVEREDWGLIDPATTLLHDGRTHRPIKKRVSEVQYPITRQMGVYVLHNTSAYGGVNAVQDVTDDVIPDKSPCTVRLATGSLRSARAVVMGTQAMRRWDQT